MNINEIIQKEPALIPIIKQAKKIGESKLSSKEKDLYWYHDLKHKMMRCVGFGARLNELSSSEVYDTTYQYLIKLIKI